MKLNKCNLLIIKLTFYNYIIVTSTISNNLSNFLKIKIKIFLNLNNQISLKIMKIKLL